MFSSSGSIKTLFSRRSILNASGEPTATVVTGSATSMTVKCFSAVCTRTTRSRDAVSVSIFCAANGARASGIMSIPNKPRLMTFLPSSQAEPGNHPIGCSRAVCLLDCLRSLKPPGLPGADRRVFQERLFPGFGIKLPDARGITIHEHRITRSEPFLASCQEPHPVFTGAKHRRPAITDCRTLAEIRERNHAIPDLSRSFLDGE